MRPVHPALYTVNPRFGKLKVGQLPEVIAHRGPGIHELPAAEAGQKPKAQVYMENTVEALRETGKLSIPAVEFDVITTRVDGTAPKAQETVMHHDDHLGGDNGNTEGTFNAADGSRPLVRDLTYDQVQKLARFNPGYYRRAMEQRLDQDRYAMVDYPENASLGTLKAGLSAALAEKPDLHFYPELKTFENYDPLNPLDPKAVTNGMERKVVDELIEIRKEHPGFNPEKQVTLIGFNPWVVQAAKSYASECGLNITTGWDVELTKFGLDPESPEVRKKYIDTAIEMGFAALCPSFKDTTQALVDEADAKGLKVIPWVSGDVSAKEREEWWPRLLEYGVDGIITNHPTGLMTYLKDQAASRTIVSA